MSIEQEPRIEGMREMYLREKAKETVEAFDLETFFSDESADFDAHMDTMAAYLDSIIVPTLAEEFTKQNGAEIEDREKFFEEFRTRLIEEVKKIETGEFSDEQKSILDELANELTVFQFGTP